MQVRGPRVLAAALVGAALAVAGTAFQGLFRNPLVSPDILGASSGAALGAVIGIFFSLGVVAIQAFAFVGGLFAVAAVYAIGSAVRSRDPILVLVLTGVVVGSLLGAGVGLVKYLADPYNQLPAMEALENVTLPKAKLRTSWLYALTQKVNTTPSLYLEAGAIHGCVLARRDDPLVYMEDVGRHNAVDKIAGWMFREKVSAADKIFYTTGRLTSEMVIKTVRMNQHALNVGGRGRPRN